MSSGISHLDDAENVDERNLKLGEALEIYVPLRFQRNAKPAGAFEMYLPYKPIAASIASDTRTAYLLLLAGSGSSTRPCSASSPGRRSGCATRPRRIGTRPSTTASPACRTARCSSTGSPGDRRPPTRRDPGWA